MKESQRVVSVPVPPPLSAGRKHFDSFLLGSGPIFHGNKNAGCVSLSLSVISDRKVIYIAAYIVTIILS